MVLETLKEAAQGFYAQFYDILEKTDFSIPTFLAFGATFQLLSLAYLPSYLSTAPPLLWLGYRLIKSSVASRTVFKTSFTDVLQGKYVTNLSSSSDGVVVFVLGARLNHPFGKLSTGMIPVDVVFKNMWHEAEKNREKWGYLGRTATLVDTSDNEGTTTIWISYWRDLKGLQGFSATTAHRLGKDNWEAGKYPYLGIMHETYHAPRGHYETIYGNFHRWGLGASLTVNTDDENNTKLEGTLIPNQEGSNMHTRMRKNV